MTFLEPSAVAELVMDALNDDSGKMRYLTSDVVEMAAIRQKLGADGFVEAMRPRFVG